MNIFRRILNFIADSIETENKEEIFHHPVTGYSGNRSNMDTYIINREKKLKNDKY